MPCLVPTLLAHACPNLTELRLEHAHCIHEQEHDPPALLHLPHVTCLGLPWRQQLTPEQLKQAMPAVTEVFNANEVALRAWGPQLVKLIDYDYESDDDDLLAACTNLRELQCDCGSGVTTPPPNILPVGLQVMHVGGVYVSWHDGDWRRFVRQCPGGQHVTFYRTYGWDTPHPAVRSVAVSYCDWDDVVRILTRCFPKLRELVISPYGRMSEDWSSHPCT